MKNLFILPLFILSLTACQNTTNKDSGNSTPNAHQDDSITVQKHPGTASIEEAHQWDKLKTLGLTRFRIKLTFQGAERLNAILCLKPDNSRIRLDYDNGSAVIYDGEQVTGSPSEAVLQSARFDIFTWAYFFSLPYKINDPGTQITSLSDSILENKNYQRKRLSFKQGTGDAPDDWYILYQDPETSRIHAAAYIVTYGGRDPQKAGENAHAIVYRDFDTIQGIPLATRWTFHDWSFTNGLGGQIGEAELSDFKFIPDAPDLFTPASDHRIIPSP